MVAAAGERARELTASEAAVIRSLLGPSLQSESDRSRASGLPFSTYRAAKRRVYENGWVEDRYVPSPRVVGVRSVRFVVARPFADRMAETSRRFRDRKGAVVVWAGQSSVFGVFFGAGDDRAGGVRAEPRGSPEPREFGLTANLREPSVPVYFDYAGAWARFTHAAELSGYPKSCGSALASNGGVPEHVEQLARDLVARPYGSEDGRAPHLQGPPLLPKSQRKIVSRGLVEWRAMPNLASLPSFEGARIEQVVYVFGELLEGATALGLFQGLTREARCFPFVYASDGERVFLALLAQGMGPDSAGPVARPAPVMETLTRRLRGIEVVREPTRTLRAITDHRYDRLFSAG